MSLLREIPELLNLAEASDALHISRSTLHRWLDSGRIQSVRYPESNRRLIPADEIVRMLDLGRKPFEPSYETCQEITVSGERCVNRPMDNSLVCGAHASSTPVRNVRNVGVHHEQE